ncbi:MAG: acyltransferase [Crocinitomicaceae bacterium]
MNYLHKILSILKTFYVKKFKRDIKVGKNVIIDFDTRINTKKNRLVIGHNVYLRSKSFGYHAGMPFKTTILLDQQDSVCEIGDNCRLNGVYIHSQKKIIIGKNTVIAAGVNILDSNGHEVFSENRTKGRDTAKEIIIGENVWIGLNSIILKGSIIGNNSIISAGSVVNGIIPDNVIVQGNPAKIVKKIF